MADSSVLGRSEPWSGEDVCVALPGAGGLVGLFVSDRGAINRTLKQYNDLGFELNEWDRDVKTSFIFRLWQVMCLVFTILIWCPNPTGLMFFKRVGAKVAANDEVNGAVCDDDAGHSATFALDGGASPSVSQRPVQNAALVTNSDLRVGWTILRGVGLLVVLGIALSLAISAWRTFHPVGVTGQAQSPNPLNELPVADANGKAVSEAQKDARLQPSTVAASSYFKRGGEAHPPAHAFDGNSNTAWNEGAPGPGRGEWLEARFAGAQRIRRIRLSTGYDAMSKKFGDLFFLNAHLKKVRIEFDPASTSVARDIAKDQRELVLDNLNITSTAVRVIAEDVWEGTRWGDLCVSEIEIDGQSADTRLPTSVQ